MALRFTSAFQRLDEALSAPIYGLSLPDCVEKVLAYPDGELFLGQKSLLPTLCTVFGIAQYALWPAPVAASGFATSAVCFVAMIFGKRSLPRARPRPETVALGARSAAAKYARTVYASDNPQYERTSFPSGGACMAMAFGSFWARYTGVGHFYAIPVLASFCRVYFCCHWVGDTLAGALLAFTLVAGIDRAAGGLRNITFSSPLFVAPTLLAAALLLGKPKRARRVD